VEVNRRRSRRRRRGGKHFVDGGMVSRVAEFET
jgi:hypothetical protein